MTTIQAYKRTKPYTHAFPGVEPLKFLPNEKLDMVCSVEDAGIVARLLQTPSGFRVYEGEEAAPKKALKLVDDDARYVLKSGESTVDLRPLSDEQLREFCTVNNIAVHHAAKGNTIRDKIVEALKVEA